MKLVKQNNVYFNVENIEYMIVDPQDIIDNKITKMSYIDESKNREYVIELDKMLEDDRETLLRAFARVEASTLVQIKGKSDKADINVDINDGKNKAKFDYTKKYIYVNADKIKYINTVYRDSTWSIVEFNIESSTLKADAGGMKVIPFEVKNTEMGKFYRLGK